MSRNAGAPPALILKVRHKSAWKLGEEQVTRGERNDIPSDHQIVRSAFAEQLWEILSYLYALIGRGGVASSESEQGLESRHR